MGVTDTGDKVDSIEVVGIVVDDIVENVGGVVEVVVASSSLSILFLIVIVSVVISSSPEISLSPAEIFCVVLRKRCMLIYLEHV